MQNAQEIQGRWDILRGKVKEKWGQLTDDDLQMVGGNIDQVMGRIQQKTGAARAEIEEFLNEALEGSTMQRTKERVSGFAQGVGERARDAGEQLKQSYGRVSEGAREQYGRAEEMMYLHPTESMAAVFGLGVVTGVVLGLMLRD